MTIATARRRRVAVKKRATTSPKKKQVRPTMTLRQQIRRSSKPVGVDSHSASAKVSLVFLRPTYYRRPVEWRFLLAERIVADRLRMGRSRMDMYVGEIVRMLRAWKAARTALDRLAVAEGFPDLFNAWELYRLPRLAGLKKAVECYLLAQTPLAEICQSSAFPKASIEWYERAFFDIRDRLSAPSLVTHVAIDAVPDTGEPPVTREIRRLSYFGGPHIARMFLQARPAPERPTTHAELRDFARRAVDLDMLVNSTLALRTLDTSCPRTRRALWRLDLQRRRVEQRRDAQRTEYDRLNAPFRENIRECLRQLPTNWVSGTNSPAQVSPSCT